MKGEDDISHQLVVTCGCVPHVDVHLDHLDQVAVDGEVAAAAGSVERVQAAVAGGGHRCLDPPPPAVVQAPRDLCGYYMEEHLRLVVHTKTRKACLCRNHEEERKHKGPKLAPIDLQEQRPAGKRTKKGNFFSRPRWSEMVLALITLEAADVAAVGGHEEGRLRGPVVLGCADKPWMDRSSVALDGGGRRGVWTHDREGLLSRR